MLDLFIAGAGAAGIAASLYAAMYKLESVCIGDKIGGKLLLAPDIIDYPGIVSISGQEYIANLLTQAKTHRARIQEGEIISIKKISNGTSSSFETKTQDKQTFHSKLVLLTTGNANKQGNLRTNQLAKALGVEEQNGLLSINRYHETNVSGVFAAGDCVIYPHSLEQLTTSVSNAFQAVACIYEKLNGKHAPILWGKSQIPRLFMTNAKPQVSTQDMLQIGESK